MIYFRSEKRNGKIVKHILAAFLSVLGLQATNADEHWSQFRGPQGNGISTTENLPVEFDEAKNVRWKIAIPDEGWSPAVAGESFILRSTTHLYCLTRGFERSDAQVAADVYPDRKKPQKTALAVDENIDWEEAYTQLLKKHPGVREKVESGGVTKEQVIAWMKKQARSRGKRSGK